MILQPQVRALRNVVAKVWYKTFYKNVTNFQCLQTCQTLCFLLEANLCDNTFRPKAVVTSEGSKECAKWCFDY